MPAGPRLLIAIPALNEEASIEETIRRCLAAREHIVATTGVSAVEITVVSDGSTDRTVELASRYVDQYPDQVQLIVFPQNRGYGAAIQEAWRRSDCELLAFLDADGTCDPRFFAELCRALDAADAAVVLGSRLDGDSAMPFVRRLGNWIFAAMLTLFSAQRVRDSASGMRVVRRSALPRLMPLPDGLHFTPAMSARAVLSGDLGIVEVGMPYHEREGQSKLKVFRDGLRFLRVIVEETLRHRPGRLLGLGGTLCLAAAVLLMIEPALYYLRHRSVLEWMIYRFVVSDLAATLSALLFCSGYLADRIVRVTLAPRRRPRSLLDRLFESRWFFAVPLALLFAGGLLVLPSALELVETGGTYEHWSRFIVMSSCFSVAFVLAVTRLVVVTVDLVAERVAYLAEAARRAVRRDDEPDAQQARG
ncbi:MAG TPA: glycosyltransferase family 2 protein [Thermoanaerobaculia bacterium]|nr:glycosyltransferase family 2 protein [Thermoanaerobaculia bacterium]